MCIVRAARFLRAIPRSVISAKVKLALRCKSMFSENTSVLSARRGSPEKKSVSPRCILGKKMSETNQNELRLVVQCSHFRGTVTSPQQLRARCPREQAHTSHRELVLPNLKSASLSFRSFLELLGTYRRKCSHSMSSCWHPWLSTAGKASASRQLKDVDNDDSVDSMI
jgi:hypothetical protein